MYKHTLRGIAFIITALIPFAVANAQTPPPPPDNITELEARFEDGELTVEWEPVEDESGIDFYRIYYSRESILENNGNYDDFEPTTDSGTGYTFPVIPYYDTDLYIAILAVNMNGDESEAFEVEAKVTIPEKPMEEEMTSSSSSSEEQTPEETTEPEEVIDTSAPFLMLHAITRSSMEISINFSEPIAEQEITTDQIRIVSETGEALAVTEVSIDGSTLVAKTAQQNPSAIYTVASVGALKAENGTMLQPTSTDVVFRGHPANMEMPYGENPDKPKEEPAEEPVEEVTPPKEDNTSLPNSGVGVLGAMLLAGGVAGHRTLKRKSRQ